MKLTKQYISSLLPKRPKDANKGIFGKVLVIAGSQNYPGAAYLSCAAVYRVGAGLVTLLTKPSVKIIVAKKLPEVTFLSPNELNKKLLEYDVTLLGPGLSQKKETMELMEKLINKAALNMVIDADGLNVLSKISGWWEKLKAHCVLTPHPGEMARLTGLEINEIQRKRLDIAQKFAKKWNQTVVLKGANTIIASSSGEVAISPFANPALATAGTGDILAGIIGGLLAQGLGPFDAACAGVYLHSMVGEKVKEKLGDAGMLASDLIPLIPKVLVNVTKH